MRLCDVMCANIKWVIILMMKNDTKWDGYNIPVRILIDTKVDSILDAIHHRLRPTVNVSLNIRSTSQHTSKTCGPLWVSQWNWTVCSKHTNHVMLSSEHNRELGLSYRSRRKRVFALQRRSLLIRRDDESWASPTARNACEVGSAHNKTALLTSLISKLQWPCRFFPFYLKAGECKLKHWRTASSHHLHEKLPIPQPDHRLQWEVIESGTWWWSDSISLWHWWSSSSSSSSSIVAMDQQSHS